MYRHQTLIRGFNTFSFTCAVRYFQHLIINQVTELTWLCYDLCLFCYIIITHRLVVNLLRVSALESPIDTDLTRHQCPNDKPPNNG
jgi:hypothetical protein